MRVSASTYVVSLHPPGPLAPSGSAASCTARSPAYNESISNRYARRRGGAATAGAPAARRRPPSRQQMRLVTRVSAASTSCDTDVTPPGRLQRRGRCQQPRSNASVSEPESNTPAKGVDIRLRRENKLPAARQCARCHRVGARVAPLQRRCCSVHGGSLLCTDPRTAPRWRHKSEQRGFQLRAPRRQNVRRRAQQRIQRRRRGHSARAGSAVGPATALALWLRHHVCSLQRAGRRLHRCEVRSSKDEAHGGRTRVARSCGAMRGDL